MLKSLKVDYGQGNSLFVVTLRDKKAKKECVAKEIASELGTPDKTLECNVGCQIALQDEKPVHIFSLY